MPLLPLVLPPGMMRAGTKYSSRGRWYDGNLVRFTSGTIQPVGGWAELTATSQSGIVARQDTFVDTNGTALNSHTPTPATPDFAWQAGDTDIGTAILTIQSNAVVSATNDAAACHVTTVSTVTPNYAVGLVVTVPTGAGASQTLGVSARHGLTTGGGYYLSLNTAGLLKLQAVGNDGVATATSSLAVPSFALDTAYTLSLSCVGATITGSVDGSVLVSLTDSTWTGKYAGLFGTPKVTGGTSLTGDSFTVTTSGTITLDGIPRTLLGWRGNDGSQSIGMGTNTKLYAHWLGSLYDITPSGFTEGTADAAYTSGGYGEGLYGAGPYGVSDASQTTLDPPAIWHLDTFGDYLVGCCSPNDGKLYYWDRNVNNVAVVMSGAPTGCQGVVVTPERFVVALGVNSGSAAGVRRVEWSAQESLTNWTATGAYATGTLTSTGSIPSDGDTVTIGSKTYTLKTTLTGVNGQVLINGSAANALTNLYNAVNLTGTSGTDYAAATTANSQVEATAHTSTTVTFQAITVGSDGNAIPSTETGSTLSFGGTTLSGGIDDGGAGGYTLEGRGAIVAGRRSKAETLIWTTDDLWAMRYIGGTLIYGFERIGGSCGLIAPGAIGQIDVQAVWMGYRNFFLYDGYVRPLPCDVADFVFTYDAAQPGSGLNEAEKGKVTCVTVAQYGEVTWYYPSASSNETDRYVTWNYRENHWTLGALDRTCGCDRGALEYPTLAASNGKVYEHERAFSHLDTDGSTAIVPYLEAGPVELGNGDQVFAVSQIIPDERTQGDTELSLYTSFLPDDSETLHGPFTTASRTDARFTGRWVRPRIDEVTSGDWRVGTIRLDGTAAGKR